MRIVKRLAVIALAGLLFGQVDAQKKGASKCCDDTYTLRPQVTQRTGLQIFQPRHPQAIRPPPQTGSTQTTSQQPSATGLPDVSSTPTNALPQLTSSAAFTLLSNRSSQTHSKSRSMSPRTKSSSLKSPIILSFKLPISPKVLYSLLSAVVSPV